MPRKWLPLSSTLSSFWAAAGTQLESHNHVYSHTPYVTVDGGSFIFQDSSASQVLSVPGPTAFTQLKIYTILSDSFHFHFLPSDLRANVQKEMFMFHHEKQYLFLAHRPSLVCVIQMAEKLIADAIISSWSTRFDFFSFFIFSKEELNWRVVMLEQCKHQLCFITAAVASASNTNASLSNWVSSGPNFKQMVIGLFDIATNLQSASFCYISTADYRRETNRRGTLLSLSLSLLPSLLFCWDFSFLFSRPVSLKTSAFHSQLNSMI